MNENLMLTLDDAVEVAMDYIHNHCDDYGIDEEDEELIRSEMEQKCWVNRCHDDTIKYISELIMDVNPVEICSQIQNDHLKRWCESLQAATQLALMKMPEVLPEVFDEIQ